MLSSKDLIELVGHLAWPVTVIFACAIFYRPLSNLIDTLGRRMNRFSIFKVDVELGPLTKAVALNATVDRLRSVQVSESGLAPIVAGVVKSSSADYLVVNIGDAGDAWLTSRLFLLAAILERSRAIRCVVFLDGSQRFVGAATARDIRRSIGTRYVIYEIALASAYGRLPSDPDIFKSGLNEALINLLSSSFLEQQTISSTSPPAVPAGWATWSQSGGAPQVWEFADWITASSLDDLLGRHLLTDSVVADVGPINTKTTKSLARPNGPFVALVGSDRTFKDICDRHAVLESLAREAVEQSTE